MGRYVTESKTNGSDRTGTDPVEQAIPKPRATDFVHLTAAVPHVRSYGSATSSQVAPARLVLWITRSAELGQSYISPAVLRAA